MPDNWLSGELIAGLVMVNLYNEIDQRFVNTVNASLKFAAWIVNKELVVLQNF